MKLVSFLFAVIIVVIIFSSCSDNSVVTPAADDLLYEEPGLVDSAVVTSCYDYTRSHFLMDTFSISGYRKLKVEFEALTSSDRAKISFVEFSPSVNNRILYIKSNSEINSIHKFEIDVPADSTWYELRLFLSPQVCGENEYKFIRARDLKLYGIK